MDVIHLTDRNHDAVVEKTASLLKRGGVAALPTDTVYGLVADVLREAAVRKVFRIKARSHAKALPVFVRDIAQAKIYAYIDTKLARLLDEIWPGPTTVVLHKKIALPDFVTGEDKTVGLRIPNDRFILDVLKAFPNPLTGTSANISGTEAARSATEVQNTFKDAIPRPDVIVDGSDLPESPPSTVLDLTNPKNPKILRMGATTPEKLMELLAHWEKP